MKYYDYSVRTVLCDYFGNNPVCKMREKHDGWFEYDKKANLRELCWKYADNMVLAYFLEENYLIETLIEDDYMVYLYQFETQKCAYIMFMLTEEAPFSIDLEYALYILRDWESKGYNTKLISACVAVEYNDKIEKFHFCSHSCEGMGVNKYSIKLVNGEKRLVFTQHRCWRYFYEKLIAVSRTSDIKEYECLFEHDVVLSQGEGRQKEILATGENAIKEFLQKNSPVKVFYRKFHNTNIYSCSLSAGKYELIIYVNNRNLISQVNISNLYGEEIIYEETLEVENLIDRVPKLLSVRPLDMVQIHGYGIQMEYENGYIGNYYLKMFEQWQLPKSCLIDGYRFDEEELTTVKITPDKGISFKNGYSIEGHILYYRSYRQLQPIKTKKTYYNKNGIKLESVYRIPLKEFKSHFALRYYWGYEDECYGPAEALTDKNGCRISDISLYYNNKDKWSKDKVYCVRVEPTGKYGFLSDGNTWLAPPIYDDTDDVHGGCTKVKRKVNGEMEQFILTASGKEIAFPYEVDFNTFHTGLRAFNVEKWDGDIPDKGYYYDYDWIEPGKWGFIDKEGNVVIEPQYVYVDGFNYNEYYSIVAKMVDGKTCWGVIDRDGKETIPCQYDSLYTRWGQAVAFRKNYEDKYGLMDFEGNIILGPMFDYIEAYDKKHKLVTAGEQGDALGVYSIEKGKFIIPTEYDCVDYGERIISCEIPLTCKERYFDYEGNEWDFSQYDSIWETDGYIKVYKDDKVGMIDYDGNEVIPLKYHRSNELKLKLCKKGIRITGDYNCKGLAVNGKEVIPAIYSEIKIYEKFVIASNRTKGNWCIKDTLFTMEGEPILDGAYRNICVSETQNEVTAETPEGKVFFRVEVE